VRDEMIDCVRDRIGERLFSEVILEGITIE
jgi:hypothetical protein